MAVISWNSDGGCARDSAEESADAEADDARTGVLERGAATVNDDEVAASAAPSAEPAEPAPIASCPSFCSARAVRSTFCRSHCSVLAALKRTMRAPNRSLTSHTCARPALQCGSSSRLASDPVTTSAMSQNAPVDSEVEEDAEAVDVTLPPAAASSADSSMKSGSIGVAK